MLNLLVPLIQAFWILATSAVLVTLSPLPLPSAFKSVVYLTHHAWKAGIYIQPRLRSERWSFRWRAHPGMLSGSQLRGASCGVPGLNPWGL